MSTSSDPDALLEQRIQQLEMENLALRGKIAEKAFFDTYVWALFVEISRKLQASSASIKAAVSSLLDHDILWDGASQNEFIETIELSANRVGDLILLLSLMFRCEANGLELKHEPQVLMEILAAAADHLSAHAAEKQVQLEMPGDGKLVRVDYEYLIIALKLIFDALIDTQDPDRDIRIEAVENELTWFVDIYGFDPSVMLLVQQLLRSAKENLTAEGRLSVENRLGIFVAGRILQLQLIEPQKIDQSDGASLIRLTIKDIILP